MKQWIDYNNGARPIKLRRISYIGEQYKCKKGKRRSIIKMFGVGRRKLNQILHTTAAVATVVIFWFVLFCFCFLFRWQFYPWRFDIWLLFFLELSRWLILRLFRPSATQSERISQVFPSNTFLCHSHINQSIIIAWSIPYCHCLNVGSLILYYWC